MKKLINKVHFSNKIATLFMNIKQNKNFLIFPKIKNLK